MITVPFRSELEHVYHNNTTCIAAQNIRPWHAQRGTGGLPLCWACLVLNAIGK